VKKTQIIWTVRVAIVAVLGFVWLAAQGISAGIADQTEGETRFITGEAATVEAMRFMKIAGWSVTEKPATRFVPAHTGHPDVWEIKVNKHLVEVDAKTGKVRLAIEFGPVAQKRPGIPYITEKAAQQAAAGYLSKLGVDLGGARLEETRLDTYWSQKDAKKWTVVYARVYKGYPFKYDSVQASIDPVDATLISFSQIYPSPLPEMTKVKVKPRKAEAKAREHMAQIDAPLGKMIEEPELRIVQPDTYWEPRPRGENPKKSSISRLAWVMRFDEPWEITEVWVDAANGRVVGGFKGGMPKEMKEAMENRLKEGNRSR